MFELKPDYAEAYNGLANIYNATRKFDQAAAASAKAMELSMLQSLNTLANTVAAIVPTMTGHRAFFPRPITRPAATPAAGQKTATPSGVESSSRLIRAAAK